MIDKIDEILNNLYSLKEQHIHSCDWEEVVLIRDACDLIKTLRLRPKSEAEVEKEKQAKRKKDYSDALTAVHDYFQGAISRGEFYDPDAVGRELALTIKNFGG